MNYLAILKEQNIYLEKVDRKTWKKFTGSFTGYRTPPSNYGAFPISENKCKTIQETSNIYVSAKKMFEIGYRYNRKCKHE